MTQRPWLDYAGQQAAELFALAESHRVDSLVVAFEQAIGIKAHDRGADALSRVEWDCLAIEALEREVNNGGYEQFFTNSSNEFAGVIVGALERAGCPETAGITADAIAALGPGAELRPAALESLLQEEDEARSAALRACSDAYFGMSEDIAGRLFDYLGRNRDHVSF